MYVCLCNGVTDRDIAKAVEHGADDLTAVEESTGAATGCGSCKDMTKTILDQCLAAKLVHAA